MDIIKGAFVLIRFLLELTVIVALVYWAFRTQRNTLMRAIFGIGAAAVAVGLWTVFGAPGAPFELHDPLHWLLQLAFFGSAAMALVAAHRAPLGVALAILAAINRARVYVWHQ